MEVPYTEVQYKADEKQDRTEKRAAKKQDKEDGIISLGSQPRDDGLGDEDKKHKPISGHEIYEVSILDVSLHDIANEHPLHDEVSRNALRADLDMNGQIEPVTVYKGKIVDGRHRYWLLKELGIDNILVKKLPDSYTLEDVRSVVFSSEMRRHQTPTQRAIQAYMFSISNGISQSKAAKKFGASKQMVSKANYVNKHKGNQALVDLYHGKKVTVGTRSTDSLSVYVKLVEEELDAKRKANSTSIPMSDEDVRRIAKPHLDALSKEHADVVAFVAKSAYRMAEER